ncbi:MAG: hypothetical protein ABR968_08260 [Bacteroidales bacterium]|jgi:hypothetical protein
MLRVSNYIYSLLFLISWTLFSCKHYYELDVNKELSSLKKTAEKIQNDFDWIQKNTQNLSNFTQLLYTRKDHYNKLFHDIKYERSDNGTLLKPKNDSASSIYVSGRYPINEEIMQVVRCTEPLDSAFKSIMKVMSPLIIQEYYIERHDYIRLYPYVDVLSQFEPKQDIDNYNVYNLSVFESNPSKGVKLISDPFVDPAGRGWMISSVAPVYCNDEMEGVVGIDIAIEAMREKYLSLDSSNLLLIDSCGYVMIMNENNTGLLEMPPLKTHKYLEIVKNDEYLSDEYNVLKSKNKEVRDAFTELIRNNKNYITLHIDEDNYYLVSYKIAGLCWYIVRLIKET